jgi:hypothetical protein
VKRLLCSLVAAGTLLAAAAPGAQGARVPPTNPSALCGPDDVYLRTIVWRGQTIQRALPMATHGGCASSWATGQMSVAAVVGQCKRLEEGVVLNGQPFALTYPHTFYGVWPAANRAGCVKVLHGLATGELDADVLPFPV